MKRIRTGAAVAIVCMGAVILPTHVSAGKALSKCNVEQPTMAKVTVRCFGTRKITGPNKLGVVAWADCRSTIDNSTIYVEDQSPAKATKISSVECPTDHVVKTAGKRVVRIPK